MRTIWGKQVRDTLEEILEPEGCGIVVVDMQNDCMHPDGKLAKAGNDVTQMQEILPRCAEFLDEARALGIKIFHVQTITLPGGVSSSPSWLRTLKKVIDAPDAAVEGTWGAEICSEVAPLPGEPVITKHRNSGFVGTDLDQILRANDVRTVVVIGEQTPGCIMATFLDAALHDYYAVLIEDCVAAFIPWEHEASLRLMRARQDVCMAADALAVWRAAVKASDQKAAVTR